MTNRLPYKLTDGVTATHVGLELPRYLEVMVREMGSIITHGYRHRVNGVGLGDYTYWSWYYATDFIRYRKGEPWVGMVETRHGTSELICGDELPLGIACKMSRIGAQLADNAQALCVLHWCVHNLPGEAEND